MESHSNDEDALSSASPSNDLRVRSQPQPLTNSSVSVSSSPEGRQRSLPARKCSLVGSASHAADTLVAAVKARESFNIIQDIKNFLLLLNFSTEKLLNSRFLKKIKNLTWGQKAFCLMLGFLVYYNNESFSQRVDGPLVKTKQGFVKGLTGVSRRGRLFYEYLGIPYARPPVGDLRFEV